MSLPPQQKPTSKRTGKRISFFNDQGVAMKETSGQQHPDGSYPGPDTASSGPGSGQSEAAGTVTSTTSNPEAPLTGMYLNSVIFSPEKGDQSRGHYQQTVPMKWAHQNLAAQPPPPQRAGTGNWTQAVNVANWGPNFAPYLGGVGDSRSQVPSALVKQPIREGPQPPSRAVEKQPAQQATQQATQQPTQPAPANPLPTRIEAYRDVRDGSKPHSLEWEQHQASQQPPNSQTFPQTLKPGALNAPPHSTSNPGGSSVLQPFQLAFGQPKPHLTAGYYQEARPPPTQEPSPESPPVPSDSEPKSPPTDARLQPPQLQLQPRRSRRLSKEGGTPPGDSTLLIPSQNGASVLVAGAPKVEQVHVAPVAPTGVIQSTRRKRRVSQEVNLETLAQKASERESLPPHIMKEQTHRSLSPLKQPPRPGTLDGVHSAKRPSDESMMPLVIPVSVPVRRPDPPLSSPGREHSSLGPGWPQRASAVQDVSSTGYKPSVIVKRRRSLRNSLSENTGQNGGTEGEKDDDAKRSKRRPRPEPLFIPPPKPGTFVVPPVYSSITPYQSHLRSPVRLMDNPLAMPPYTPPPILSPVREGTGLYFSTFLSNAAAASSQGLPPPITPKSATRSLLRSNSIDITPPVLSAICEATPVNIEPRINIGVRYQAEVPELRRRSLAQNDYHKAQLVWAPLNVLEAKPGLLERVDDLMHLACSSALHGGGTNQELALHCLYECKGDVMAALGLLLLKDPVFSRNHCLGVYHYSGSDNWTSVERRDFNKGIAEYKKDFFKVQKLVGTKTVAQCVEFYYSYKKQVKIGRNGALIYGEVEPPDSKGTEEELDHKSSQRLESRKEEEDNRKWEGSAHRTQRGSSPIGQVTLQSSENAGGFLVQKCQEDFRRDQTPSRGSHPPPSAPVKPRPAPKTGAISGTKGPAGPEGEFPCKKCGRIFYKVKSRSAHMKSHAEQEKKAAALKLKQEAEERAAALAAEQAAAAVLTVRQNGGTEGVGGDSTNDDSSDEEDDVVEDQDWH
ncbi:hypothetical protein DPEC_G00291140 [Dallia pectoralis]|uniref:Uncharacterized protein n=1 Tax=Dallia pectoralis TaxID=75939 RepID=A0ACC2FHY4_DALPE|nr:hypothetical protein DPEC_G00291140 [Dallia pectoralis]